MTTTSPDRPRRVLSLALGALGALVALLFFWRQGATTTRGVPSSAPSAAKDAAPHRESPLPRATDAPAPSTSARQGQVLRRAGWGSALEDVGRDRPAEGNPEGPLSLAATPGGGLAVLDQVNGRLVLSGAGGAELREVRLRARTPEDLAVAADGSIAVLDRTHDQSVTVLDPSGRIRGTLPLKTAGIDVPGSVTGVFVDGDDVYAEREHGSSFRLGDLAGHPAPTPLEVPGRPSRDGKSFVSAGIVDAARGRAYVASVDRATSDHRFTRELRMEEPIGSIALLDTDRAGILYFALQLPRPGGDVVRLLCLEPLHGAPLGTVEMPATSLPDEQFRAFAVEDGGGVVHAYLDGSGVTYARYDCRP